MSYGIKEIYHTIQGEGARSGREAVLCRFSGCNLWSGREADRRRAVCQFCDTDFVGGERFADAESLSAACKKAWRRRGGRPYLVLTGGEPLLQLDGELLAALHGFGFEVAVETNGTIVPPPGIDWLTVSPKAGARLATGRGDELKLVWPQPGFELGRLAKLRFRHFFLQPMDGKQVAENTELVFSLCAESAVWQPSLQLHKFLNLP